MLQIVEMEGSKLEVAVSWWKGHMDTSELKWVNPNVIWYGVNSLRLGGFQMWEGIDDDNFVCWRVKLFICNLMD